MKGIRKLIFLVLPFALLAAGAVSADPRHHGRGHDRHDYRHYRHDHFRDRWHNYYHYRAVPPPWRGPAYGYRTGFIVVMPVNPGPGNCNRRLVGTILGGSTGGLVGAAAAGRRDRLAGFAAGTVVGMLVGGAIGQSMDQADKYCVNQALETAPDGTAIHWNNGNEQYTVTPTRTGQDVNGNYCREYQARARVAGRTQQVYGTACRRPDGSWQIVN